MILESAHALADFTAEHYLKDGLIYPPISDLQKVSMVITHHVLTLIINENNQRINTDKLQTSLENIQKLINDNVWQPVYLSMVKSSNVGQSKINEIDSIGTKSGYIESIQIPLQGK